MYRFACASLISAGWIYSQLVEHRVRSRLSVDYVRVVTLSIRLRGRSQVSGELSLYDHRLTTIF